MKHILFDYLRRWGWFYVVGFIVAIGLNIPASFFPPFGIFTPYFLAPMLGPVFVLGFDLMRGSAGVTVALPVSARNVGVGYWIVGVCVPPVLLSLALILAGILVWPFNPPVTPGWEQFVLTFVISLLTNGFIFFVLTILRTGPQEGLWNNVVAGLAGALWGVSAFSGMGIKLLLDSRKGDIVTMAGLVCVALVFTILGFLRCDEVVRLRARTRFAHRGVVQKSPGTAAATARAESRITGFPYLFLESIKFSLGMALVLVLFGALFRVNSIFIHYTLLICALLPSLRYLPGLRQLRALPISLDGLAFALFLLPLVNFSVCLGVILLAEAIAAPGTLNVTPAALLLTGAIASLGNALTVRFGPKSLPFTFGIGIVVLFWLQVEFFTNLPVAGYWALSGALRIAAYGILRLSLRSSRIYRLPAAAHGV